MRAADDRRADAASAASRYRNPLWTDGIDYVDRAAQTKEVDRDIEIAQCTTGRVSDAANRRLARTSDYRTLVASR